MSDEFLHPRLLMSRRCQDDLPDRQSAHHEPKRLCRSQRCRLDACPSRLTGEGTSPALQAKLVTLPAFRPEYIIGSSTTIDRVPHHARRRKRSRDPTRVTSEARNKATGSIFSPRSPNLTLQWQRIALDRRQLDQISVLERCRPLNAGRTAYWEWHREFGPHLRRLASLFMLGLRPERYAVNAPRSIGEASTCRGVVRTQPAPTHGGSLPRPPKSSAERKLVKRQRVQPGHVVDNTTPRRNPQIHRSVGHGSSRDWNSGNSLEVRMRRGTLTLDLAPPVELGRPATTRPTYARNVDTSLDRAHVSDRA